MFEASKSPMIEQNPSCDNLEAKLVFAKDNPVFCVRESVLNYLSQHILHFRTCFSNKNTGSKNEVPL